MKGNEEAAAKALERFLTEKCGFTCKWGPTVPENAFPDFDFTVNGEKWAVECTELHQYLEQCGQEVSRVGVDRRLENLCESLRPEAKSVAIRTYIIRAFGPELNLARDEIKARAADYIRSGKTEREALDVPEVNDRTR